LLEKEKVISELQSNPSFKGAYFSSENTVIVLNSINPKSLQLKTCKETFLALPLVIYTQKSHFLLDKLSDNIEDLKASGFIEFWHRKNATKNLKTENSFQKSLNFSDLTGCFVLIFCGFFVSFTSFCCEVVYKVLTVKK
jgi:hypothetical protein